MATIVRQALLLLGLAFLPAIGQALYLREHVSWQQPAAADEVTVAQAQAWRNSTLWIDARPRDEFEKEHIPGAMLLNTEEWDVLLPAVLTAWAPDRKLVVYCSKQTCGASREVARRLHEEAGLKNVFVLQGGWEEWLKNKR